MPELLRRQSGRSAAMATPRVSCARREDDLGFSLIQSLDLPQRKIAIVEATAYKDI